MHREATVQTNSCDNQTLTCARFVHVVTTFVTFFTPPQHTFIFAQSLFKIYQIVGKILYTQKIGNLSKIIYLYLVRLENLVS